MPPFEQQVKAGFEAAGERMNELESTLAEFREFNTELSKQLKAYRKAILTESMQAGEYRGFWPDEEKAKQFGELFLSVLGRKAMAEGTQSGGGALVPDDLASWVIQKLGQYGKFRKNCLVVPMESDRLLVPKVSADLTVYCPGEGNEITDSDKSFSQVGLTPKKFCCLTKVSSELNEDSVIGIGEIMGVSIARSMSKKEDEIAFLGDGTETYFGMQGIAGALRAVDDTIGNIKSLKVASGNAYSEHILADFEGTVAILPSDADDGAKWLMNRKYYYSVVHPLAVAAGVANLFDILSDRKEKYLFGYPVEFVSAMPSTEANNQICAILGDLRLGAYLGERRELTIDRSTDVFFANDQIGIRGTERVAINAFGVGDTDEAGPIVGLITAAS